MSNRRKRMLLALSSLILSTTAFVAVVSSFVPLSSVVLFFVQPYRGPMYPRAVDLELRALAPSFYELLWTLRNDGFVAAAWLQSAIVVASFLGCCLALGIVTIRGRRALRAYRVSAVQRFLRRSAEPLDDDENAAWRAVSPDELLRLAREGISAGVRVTALRALCERHASTSQCQKALERAAYDRSPRARLLAANHIRDAGTARSVLQTLAFSMDEGIAAVSIDRLGATSGSDSEALLIRALRSTNGAARVAAVAALGNVGGRNAIAPLRAQRKKVTAFADRDLASALDGAISRVEQRLGASAPAGAMTISDGAGAGALSEPPQSGALSLPLPSSAAARRSAAGTGTG